MNAPKAFVTRPDAGEQITIGGVEHLFLLTAAQTGARFGLERFRLAPGAMGAAPHVHGSHDEYFYALSGVLTVHTGTDELELAPGELATALRDAPHGYRNASADPVEGLCLYTPAGYEQYFRDVHAAIEAGEPASEELLTRLRRSYDTRPYPA